MENTMITQGIEIVGRAIAADNEGDYDKALALYRDALQRFTMGLKYEKNAARKKLILDRVQGYMDRAEELAVYVKKQNELDKNGGAGGTASKSKGDGDDGGDDADKKKLRGALSSAIVTEKPNIRWDDVAGLESAKESLKEVNIFDVLLRVHPVILSILRYFESISASSRASSIYVIFIGFSQRIPYLFYIFRL
jgi:vacuolar protein-sorting-associated protein 4